MINITKSQINFSDKEVKEFEKRFNKKAMTKKKEPTIAFQKYLLGLNSKRVKKTVVMLENAHDINNPNRTINKSYEVQLTESELDDTLNDLIKKAQKKKITELEKQEYQKKISDILTKDIESENIPMVNNIEGNDVNAQEHLLDTSENYIGYVYFFWSAESMNFKIIGLRTINPLFEFANVKQTFYLIKAGMITNDKPIYFCFDKFPYSISFDIKDDMLILSEKFIREGLTSDIFYYMEKNKNYIRIYGFNKIPFRVWITILAFFLFALMLEYVIIFSFFLP
jgi:hypothetical protein